jgi:hypothetical protein
MARACSEETTESKQEVAARVRATLNFLQDRLPFLPLNLPTLLGLINSNPLAGHEQQIIIYAIFMR